MYQHSGPKTLQVKANAQPYKLIITIFAALSILLVSQHSFAQSQFQDLPRYPNQSRQVGPHAVLSISNNAGTHHWQFDVTQQVRGLRGGQCNNITLNRKIMGWLLLRVIGSGDFQFNVEAYNRFGNLIGKANQSVSLGHGPLRPIQISCSSPIPIPVPPPVPPAPPPPPPPPPAPHPPVVDADALSQLDLNYRMWRLQNISDYSIVSQRSCFCIRDVTLPARVQVANGQVVSRTFVESGLNVPSQFTDTFLTVEDAFAVVRDAIMEGADSINVSYDPFYGFPTNISIDYITMAADDELNLNLSDFRPAHGGGYPIPTPVPPVQPPITAPINQCQPNAYGSQIHASVDMIKDHGSVWACIRGNKANPCSTIDIKADRSGSQFNLYSREIASGTVCSQVIAPFAVLAQLDTQGLSYGVFPVTYYPLHNQENLVSTSFSLP